MDNLKVGDIKKWQGLRSSDTKEIDGGYLFIITNIDKNKKREVVGYGSKGIKIEGVSNRSQAIKKYKANPNNPNNHKYI